MWWLPPVATVVVASIIAGLGAFELVGLAQPSRKATHYLLALLAVAFCAGDALTSSNATVIIFTPVMLLGGVLTLARGVPSRSSVQQTSLIAPFYVGVPLGAIARTRGMYGPAAVSVLALMVIASDSAQYFTGRALGRYKLAPSISPAKTVEGAVGGLVASAVVGAWLGPRWLPGVTIASGALLGVLVGVVGMIGDLFESALKRGAGVKDSSNLIPGHGGVLDRIDSWLFAGPVFYLFLQYAR